MKLAIFLSSLATAMAQTSCGTGFKASGSDTVEPIAEAWLPPYQKLCPNAKPVNITAGGSSVGAKDVCAGTVDIGMMSRDFKSTEATAKADGKFDCVTGGKSVTQIAVAADGIIIVAKKGGNAAKCIAALGGVTVDQLTVIFSNATASVKMNELSSKCAAVEVKITGPDENSGTQSFFKEIVFKNGGNFRASYFMVDSPSFDEVVKTVLSSGDYIGYVPLSFYNKNKATLYAAKVKNAAGAYILPSAGTIGNGNYNPFSRRVYMNVLSTSITKTKDYIKYGLSTDGLKLVVSSGFVALPAGVITTMLKRLG